jgi:hypothetical protein
MSGGEGYSVDCGSANRPAWATPVLSTSDPAALAAYQQGIAALVAGAALAVDLLRDALAIDASFFLGQVALAAAEALDGRPFRSIAPPASVRRGERQHAEIVHATFAGDADHAADLRREHLVEFPGDLLIVSLPVLVGGRRQSGGVGRRD